MTDARRRRQRSLGVCIGLVILTVSCGNPNVPLTRPPAGAFQTDPKQAKPLSSPGSISTAALPERSGVPPVSSAIFKGRSAELSLAALTARVLGLPWALNPQSQPSTVMALTARFWDISWPPQRIAKPLTDDSPQSLPAPANASTPGLPVEVH